MATKTGDVKQDSWPYELDFVVGDGVILPHAGIPRRLLCDYSEGDPVMRRGDAWAGRVQDSWRGECDFVVGTLSRPNNQEKTNDILTFLW